ITDTAQPAGPVRLRRRLEAVFFQSGENEPVNFVAWPGFVPHGWHGNDVRRRDESPMRLVLSAFTNPAPQLFLLLRREREIRLGLRHHFVLVGRENFS